MEEIDAVVTSYLCSDIRLRQYIRGTSCIVGMDAMIAFIRSKISIFPLSLPKHDPWTDKRGDQHRDGRTNVQTNHGMDGPMDHPTVGLTINYPRAFGTVRNVRNDSIRGVFRPSVSPSVRPSEGR